MTDFATIKVRRQLRSWLKLEAARRQVPMYVLIEKLVAQSQDGSPPWERQAPAANPADN